MLDHIVFLQYASYLKLWDKKLLYSRTFKLYKFKRQARAPEKKTVPHLILP